MKVLCDVHLSYKLVNFFLARNIEAVHVNRLPKKSATPDEEITAYADKNGMVVITKDEDFLNAHLLFGKPARLIRITLGNISNQELIHIFDKNLLTIINGMQAEKCYIEVGQQLIIQI